MPYHLYLHTPPHGGSDYVAHLIEHCAMGKISDPADYFSDKKTEGESYTYYTHYRIETEDRAEVETFIEQLCKPIPESLIRYEAKILRKEFASRRYFQSLICRIGQELYGKTFSYSVSKKLNVATIQQYHAEHYRRSGIIVVGEDLPQRDIEFAGFRYDSSFSLRLRGEREFVVVGRCTPESLFVNELLQDFLDEYIMYHTRYALGEYFSNDTLAGEFEEHVFLSIDRKNLRFLSEIPPEFITAFTRYALENFDTKNQHEIDGPLMLRYGYTLSNESKKALIERLSRYYEALRVDWLMSTI